MHSIHLCWVLEDGNGNAAFEGAGELVEPPDLAPGQLTGAGVYEGMRLLGGDTP